VSLAFTAAYSRLYASIGVSLIGSHTRSGTAGLFALLAPGLLPPQAIVDMAIRAVRKKSSLRCIKIRLGTHHKTYLQSIDSDGEIVNFAIVKEEICYFGFLADNKMRSCPSCQTQYTDDSLSYCLQDGTPLRPVPATRQPTVSIDEQAAKLTDRDSVETKWRNDAVNTSVGDRRIQKNASGILLAAGLAAAVSILLAGVGAIGIWLYFRQPAADVVKNAKNGRPDNSVVPPSGLNRNISTPTPDYAPTPSPGPTQAAKSNSFSWPPNDNVNSTPTHDRTTAAQEVEAQVLGWRYQTETGDLNGLIGKYAPSVEYYNRRGAGRGLIRTDKQRAYRLYNSMSIKLSDMNVSVSDSGDAATATFDKEWAFSGSNRSTGKVRQQLKFSKLNGEWKIVGERDIKVYYTN